MRNTGWILVALVGAVIATNGETEPPPIPDDTEVTVSPLVADKPKEHRPKPYVEPVEIRKEYQLWMFTMPGCQPCNRYKYVINDYGLTYDYEGKSDVWLIDVVANPETMDDWNIDVLPTFMLVEKSDDTVIRRRELGASSVPNARYMLEKHFPELLEGR